MERAGVEYAGHRLLQIPGCAAAGGVGPVSDGRESIARVRRGQLSRIPCRSELAREEIESTTGCQVFRLIVDDHR
ncbi:hypothetical protein D3C73_1386980 [compost metagenome]